MKNDYKLISEALLQVFDLNEGQILYDGKRINFKPGITVLSKELEFTPEELDKIKKHNFGYGIDVKVNATSATFKTAKLKDLAKQLDKIIDFDTISAYEALDFPYY